MAQTNILLEAGTNELEVVEFYLEEFTPPSADAPQLDENGEPVPAKSYNVDPAMLAGATLQVGKRKFVRLV